MRIKGLLWLIGILPCLHLCAQSTKVERGPREKLNIDLTPASSYYEGEVYIKFKPGFDHLLKKQVGKNKNGEFAFGIARLDKLIGQLHSHKIQRCFEPVLSDTKHFEKHQAWDLNRWYSIQFPKQVAVKTVIHQLEALSDIIEIAEPNFIRTLFDNDPVQHWTPSDSAYYLQWHFNHTTQQGPTSPAGTDADIDLPEAWNLETGKPNVIVSVIDGGVDTSHPDLRRNLWVGNNGEHFGYNWNTNSPLLQPSTHATHVNGTIGAVNENGIGIAGIAGGNGDINSGARLMSMQIFNSSGTYAGDAATANAFVYSADRGACIAQNSWGGGSFSTILTDAIDYFIMNGGGTVMNGGIVFFSSGNNSNETQNFPGTYPPVVCVAATNYNDKKSWYSVYGDWVDISAPGGELNEFQGGPTTNGGKKAILSTIPGNSYGWMHGTSMACPHVSGVAALCISKSPGTMTNDQLRNILLTTVDDIAALNPAYAGKLGAGRINAFAAVQKAALQNSPVVDSARNFSATQNCGQATLTWTKNAANNNVMIAVADSLVFGVPSGNYNVGDMLPGSGKIVYKGNGTSTNISIPINQRKYFKIWSYVGSNYSFSRTTSSMYKLVVSSPEVTDESDCLINISWDDVFGCNTDSVMLVAHNRKNYGTPAGILQVGDTITGGAKVIYKGRGNSYAYTTDLDSTIYIQKWNFNASAQYSNPDPFTYYDVNKLNAIAAINVIAINNSQLNINWQNNTDVNCFAGSNYILAYSATGVFGEPSGVYTVGANINGGGTIIYIGADTSFQHTGLEENSSYCYRVWKLRNGSEYSFGKQACGHTLCTVNTIHLPYHYGFNAEELSDPDPCLWNTENNTSIANALKIVTAGTHPDLQPLEGQGMLRFNAYNVSSDETARLNSKAIKKGAENAMDIRFRWYQDSSNYTSATYDNEGVLVQWRAADSNWKNLEFYPRVPKQGLTGWSYKQISLPAEALAYDTVYISFLFTSSFGNNVFLDDLYLQNSVYKASDGITSPAVCESTDSSSQWTNYYDSLGYRLLSIKKNGQNIGKAGNGSFQLKLGGNANASLIAMTANNYVSNTGGWLCMNRYYEFYPTTEPNNPINIQFYFTSADINGLNASGGNLSPPRNNINYTDLFAYKVNAINTAYDVNPTHGHVNIPLAGTYTSNGFYQYFNSARADTAGWKFSAIGNGVFAMEYATKNAGGGGLGIGSANGYGAVQLITYTFTGNGNWNIASNWANNAIPPAILPGNARIIINPVGTGECVLNVMQRIMPGAAFKIEPGKKFRVTGAIELK